MNYFDRKCIARIGLKDHLTWLEIEGLHLAFEVEKTSTRTCNTAELDLWNLSKATRDKIYSDGQSLEILAGYEEAGGVKLIFKGDITYTNPGAKKGRGQGRGEILSRRQGADIITHLEAADGNRALRETYVELSYQSGYKAGQILNGLIDSFRDARLGDFKLSARAVPSIPEKVMNKGFSFQGLAAEALDKICNLLDVTWSVQNQQLQILKRRADNSGQAVMLSPGTGLIGSPEHVYDLHGVICDEDNPIEQPPQNITRIVKPRQVLKGWKAESLLHPTIEPGGLVYLQSADIPEATLFRVWSVKHKGDNFDRGPFTSTSELIPRQAA